MSTAEERRARVADARQLAAQAWPASNQAARLLPVLADDVEELERERLTAWAHAGQVQQERDAAIARAEKVEVTSTRKDCDVVCAGTERKSGGGEER